jgi:hypothetical protein
MCVGLHLPLPRSTDEHSPLQREMARRLEERNKRHVRREGDVSAAMDDTDDGVTAAKNIVKKGVSVTAEGKERPPTLADQDAYHHHAEEVEDVARAGIHTGIKAMAHQHAGGTADGEGFRGSEVVGVAPTWVKKVELGPASGRELSPSPIREGQTDRHESSDGENERGSKSLGEKREHRKRRDRRKSFPDGKQGGSKGASELNDQDEWSRWVELRKLQTPSINSCASASVMSVHLLLDCV